MLDCALGSGNVEAVGWDSVNRNMQTVSLKSVIDMTGGCDFLKCDCEGAEWLIDPHDLGKIRRIEMELHLPPIGGLPNPLLLDYISRNYDFQVDYMPSQAPFGLLGYLHATRDSGNPGEIVHGGSGMKYPENCGSCFFMRYENGGNLT